MNVDDGEEVRTYSLTADVEIDSGLLYELDNLKRSLKDLEGAAESLAAYGVGVDVEGDVHVDDVALLDHIEVHVEADDTEIDPDVDEEGVRYD